MIRIVTSLVFALAVAACGGSKVSALKTPATGTSGITVIALMPNGGLLADAFGVELANHGYTIIDAATTSTMMIRLKVDFLDGARRQAPPAHGHKCRLTAKCIKVA
ncbi:MAG: hypothetical protein ACKOEC_22805 [Acidimicrobiia bacterium]